MRTDFTSGFNTSRNSKTNAPVNLLQIDWPAMNGLPILTLRLADREGITINSLYWYPMVNDMGNLDRLVSPDQTDSTFLPQPHGERGECADGVVQSGRPGFQACFVIVLLNRL